MKRIVPLLLITLLTGFFVSCEQDKIEDTIKGPQVLTLDAQKGSYLLATLSGRVYGLENVALDFQCGIEYSTDINFAEDKTIRLRADKKYSEDPYSVIVSDIIPGQVYYFRAYYINQLILSYGEVKTFSFLWSNPELLAISAELDSIKEVVILKGEIKGLKSIRNNLKDYYSYIYYGIEYSTTDSFESGHTHSIYPNSNDLKTMGDTLVCYLNDFNYDLQYYYRVFFRLKDINCASESKSFILKWTGPQMIDLGLSVKWASCNIGALKMRDTGELYAWGETETKNSYDLSNYKFRSEGDSYYDVKFYKYNTDSTYGPVDNKTTLDSEDDVANIKWGDEWRMPTEEEIVELRKNCTWTKTSMSGINGYKIQSNKAGFTDNYIFLPTKTSSYWTSSLYSQPIDAYCLSLNDSYAARSTGKCVRPVYPSETWSNNLTLEVDLTTIAIGINEITILNANAIRDDEDVNYLVKIDWSSDDPSIASINSDGVITGVSVGTTDIIASTFGKKATCTVTVTEPLKENDKDYVDLGLSVKWALCNLDASKPEEYGGYYAWGETETKNYYYRGYSRYKFGDEDHLEQYNNFDNLTTLELEDDAAHINWGGNWRMPTKEELDELVNNCTWYKVTLNGVNGFIVRSEINNNFGKAIFLPAAGYFTEDTIKDKGTDCCYWSSSLLTDGIISAKILHRQYSGFYVRTYGYEFRYRGLSIRPVCP